MSWLLENWFGSKESLEQVREDIHEHLHKEFYLGVSGIENPEQSSTRIASNELDLVMNGPWDNSLDEAETELLQYIHDELPPVVRDEIGIVPFFTQVTDEGYVVLTYIRNATDRSVLLQKLPLTLMTEEGEVVARKTFDLIPSGPIGDLCSRPFEFMFRWNEFSKLPEQEVPMFLTYQKPAAPKEIIPEVNQGLSKAETEKYMKQAEQAPVASGQVDLQVLDITAGADNGIRVVVAFRNGLEKRLEFTEVPIIVNDEEGNTVARMQYTLQNMKVEAQSNRVWAFEVPASSIKQDNVDMTKLTAVIPKARQSKKQPSANHEVENNKGLLQ
ncbi:SLAP domain-containing protein [Brevibacillus choshinensis]|uniref:SLAP domain-containing protein n=1 Tax=Brevibacillus choshinensis TaxID=54911 RepID=A0ABX7FNT2_BRECH|nr:SLAP domain-containing protein [Brevibacillus choshinensis]QRG67332.1 SLAP domain-containing protein [Brevibacillus choshinensis]